MSREKEPNIHFAGRYLPAHRLWSRTEIVLGCNEFVARLNEQLPEYATEQSRAVVPEVRRRLKAIEVAIPPRFRVTREIERAARALLSQNTVEEALERFNREHDQEMSLTEFVHVVGTRAYHLNLREEAREWEPNKVLPSQTAQIWNEQRRPAPGEPPRWTADKVERLLNGAFS